MPGASRPLTRPSLRTLPVLRPSSRPTWVACHPCRQRLLRTPRRRCSPRSLRLGSLIPKEPPRKRSKAHLLFVREQPCLVCRHTPCDAHHLKFAQPRALGRKVSDEFTVPLCRAHHQELHQHGNERAWWANLQIAPLPVAQQLWAASPIHQAVSAAPVPISFGAEASR